MDGLNNKSNGTEDHVGVLKDKIKETVHTIQSDRKPVSNVKVSGCLSIQHDSNEKEEKRRQS